MRSMCGSAPAQLSCSLAGNVALSISVAHDERGSVVSHQLDCELHGVQHAAALHGGTRLGCRTHVWAVPDQITPHRRGYVHRCCRRDLRLFVFSLPFTLPSLTRALGSLGACTISIDALHVARVPRINTLIVAQSFQAVRIHRQPDDQCGIHVHQRGVQTGSGRNTNGGAVLSRSRPLAAPVALLPKPLVC